MKNIFISLALAFGLFTQVAQAQTPKLKVGTNPTALDKSAALEVQSTNKGFLPPRMKLADINNIQEPAEGLVVYCTDCYPKALLSFDGENWIYLTGNEPITITEAVLIQIGNEGDNPDNVNAEVTATEISSITGITDVVVANEVSYQDYIDANPDFFSSPATVAEVQAMITAVNNAAPTSNGTALISGFSCSTGSTGTLTEGTTASGVTQTITATVTTTGTYNISASANGVTFSGSGTFSGTGSQNIVLTASGTPAAQGTFSYTLNTTPNCSFNRSTIMSVTIPGEITLAENRDHLIASIYDNDYLPYTLPTGSATTATENADGTTETKVLNFQGTITTSGITVYIPVTATGTGTLPAYSNTITIPASLIEDGISRNITLSWAAQAFDSNKKSITATIAAVGGTLNIKKLDLNAGLGPDYQGIELGEFIYPFNNAGNTTLFKIRVVPGIPDKMFGIADNTGSTTSHLMLYFPVTAEDGNVYLSHNLGANYANINSGAFNPLAVPSSRQDRNAYGSQFQFGRKPDGHELMNWTDNFTGTPVNGITTTRTNNPTHAQYILNTSSPFTWYVNYDDTRWDGEASANNPCPKGFRVINRFEDDVLIAATNITNVATAYSNTVLKFTTNGFLNNDGTMFNTGFAGSFFASTGIAFPSGATPYGLAFYASSISINFANNGSSQRGAAVRCIKN